MRANSLRTIARFVTLLGVTVLGVILLNGSVHAQRVRIPADALADHPAVQQVLHRGRSLEQSERWTDALNLYEDACKEHPGSLELEERLGVAKRHFSLARRYGDTSYVRSLDSLSQRQALKLYAEVLGKIQSHYVHQPSWRGIVQQGAGYLETALSSQPFLTRNTMRVSAEDVHGMRVAIRQRLANQQIRTIEDAEAVVEGVAQLASRQLGLRPQATILEFACGAANSLDTYSAFLTPDQLDDVMSQIEGNFVGLGIELKTEKDTLLIINVIGGGPADKAGVRAGERIVQVDNKTISDITPDVAAEMLRGPDGSQVEVVLAAADDSTRRVRMTRRRVEVPSIEKSRIIDPEFGVAYLRLTSFQKTTSRDLDSALWSLHRQGMRTLILDVRGNPGGLLPASVDVADRFVSQGVIVSTRGRSAREDFDYRAHTVGTWRVPLTVLIDGDSASASEIFAGAIRDHRRGTVVGQRSFGKGSVQGIFHLSAGGMGVRMTTAKFYSPDGREISKNGVKPHIVVGKNADSSRRVVRKVNVAGDEADEALDRAVKVAREQVNRR